MAVATVLGLLAGLLAASPAHAAGSAHIEGTVTAPGGGLPDAPVQVIISTTSWDNPVTTQTTTTDAATGFYSFDAPPGDYYLRFEYLGSANILPLIWSNGALPGYAGGPTVTLTDGSPLVLNRELRPGATITGVAVGAGGVALESLSVRAWIFLSYGRSSFDPATGIYTLDRLPPGSFWLEFTSTERWKTGSLGPPYLTVTSGGLLTGQDIVLASSPTIEGRLAYRSAEAGIYPAGVGVYLRNPSTGSLPAYTVSESDGSYHFYDVTPGAYQVCVFGGPGRLIAFPNCAGDEPLETAPSFTVADEQVLSDVDIPIDPAGAIEGRILARLSTSSGGSPLSSGRINVYRWDGDGYAFQTSTTTQLDGTFAVGPLTPGDYRLRFSDDNGIFDAEYWQESRYFSGADDVVITTGSTLDLPDVTLDARSLEASRITGTDRFATAVEISQALYGSVPPGGVPVVYVANGLNYPDALAAGPAAAAAGGVVLLTLPWELPAVVGAELARLDPQRIVAVGGLPSISADVFAELATYVDSPAQDILRISGSDRFATSREIALDSFDQADVAFIATGMNYPDALAAGPAAGLLGAPIILVNGAAGSMDAETLELLDALGVDEVYIIGGFPSISAGIEGQLDGLLGSANVERLTGANRFETAVAISQEFFSISDGVFLATGYNFPDALAGGPAAAALGAPLYLSRPDCIPAVVLTDILDVGANAVVLLGGTPSLSANVEAFGVC